MIEVFKTNIHRASQAKRLVSCLLEQFPGVKINVDLQDCDKVLRVEGTNFLPDTIIALVKENGFACSAIE